VSVVWAACGSLFSAPTVDLNTLQREARNARQTLVWLCLCPATAIQGSDEGRLKTLWVSE
jgi:hypothetical protein